MWNLFKSRDEIIQQRIDSLAQLWQDLSSAYLKETDFDSMDILKDHMNCTHRAIQRMYKLKNNKHETKS